jgi:TIR domain
MSPAPRSVFISHAGSNRSEAGRVRDLLHASNLEVRLDVSEVQPGVSFVAFMESALSKSDYCLLLWSRAAGESKWVRVEWEAALHRAISDAPGFLVVCRLESHEVPVLLRPRLFVDLFPQLEPGVERVLTLLKDDAAAGAQTNKPVAKPRTALTDEGEGARIYVTSKLFGRTFPIRVPLGTPVVAVVEQIVGGLELPRDMPGAQGVGLRFEYGLATEDNTLVETKSLADQGIAENSVLWLETTVGPFSGTQPVRTSAGRATYRSAPRIDASSPSLDKRRADDALRSRIRALGLD